MRIRPVTILGIGISPLILGLAACGSGSADGGGGGGNDELNPVIVATQTQQSYAQMHIAEQLGYFEDEGLVLEKIDMERGAGPVIAALSNGSADVSVQAPAVLAAANEGGGDLRFFCGTASQMNSVILADSGTDIEPATASTWQDSIQNWKGKTLGVPALEGAAALSVQTLLAEAGLAPGDVQLVPVGIGENSFQALKNGEIDLLFSVPFYNQQWENDSEVVFDWPNDAPENLSRVMQGGWMASEAWLNANPDTATAFCAAMDRGIENALTEEEVTSTVLGGKFGLQDEALDAAMADDGPLTLQSAELDCVAADAALAGAFSAGLTNEEHTCEDVFWEGVL